MTGFVTLYATFADGEEAARIARILVEERLAACANILGPIRSIYRWEGTVHDDAEARVALHTRRSLVAAIVA
ncbi:MAG: divalent-cation tolerance protein CutA, partial [Allosphingosinicella sp.]